MFNEFLESVDEMEGELNQEMGIYLSNFLTLPVGQDPPNRRCANYDSFLRMQTTTEEGIKMLDKLARRKEKPSVICYNWGLISSLLLFHSLSHRIIETINY